ncbi:MAG: histidine kinase [Chryseolinea sp.]
MRERTIYRCSQVLQDLTVSVDIVLQNVVESLSDALPHPDDAVARLVAGADDFVTANFAEPHSSIRCEFETSYHLRGYVELGYRSEGHWSILPEEREFVNMIAHMIATYLERRYHDEALRLAHASHKAVLNNTIFMIWSVDREYRLTSFNRPFELYVQNRFGVKPEMGTLLTINPEPHFEVIHRWMPRYDRALLGESFKANVGEDNDLFEYSLSPIVENQRIIGVTVFGEDISERIRHQEEMIEINRQLAETRLMALRGAMNPHFVFNCLNSIQFYIMKRDQKSAVLYLSKFSKLIRTILDHTVLSRGKLKTAIDLIYIYAELEALRFEDPFDLIVEIDPSLDIELIEIPSMLIQPYLENAILHGLYNKEGKGTLSISFNGQDDILEVAIKDNGIGRVAAARQRQLSLPKHRSLGTSLTEERLKLVNGEHSTTVEVIDLEENGVPAGTLVKLWIKI